MSKKLVLIDGHSILNRAFYGIPDLTNSEGLHTNAVYGFLNIMFKILDEEKADFLTVAFDVKAPTFRHEMFAEYKSALAASGEFELVSEKKMYAGSVITGCGPAFVCMFIEALADGGVMTGLTRQQAQSFAVDTLIGTAELIKQSGKHPGQLKDEVCSPGGSTIAGVVSLEKNGLRNAAVQCVLDTFKRILDMGGIDEKDVV